MLFTRTVPLFAALFLTTLPDEGQWLPQQVRDMDWDALRDRGMRLTRDEFWHPTKGGVLTAAVQINGCSASFCSPEGLVVTNHHCGFGAINSLSTPEQNYLRDGFVAESKERELPAPGVQVSVVRRIEDVTEQVHAAQGKTDNDLDRYLATQEVIAELVADGEREPNTTCSVASFFEGREYHLYYRTRITDVRLVYAPPRAVGEFGGDIDNWEWPRHTGDFSFFRAYVAPDGSPRAYRPDNVPFRPEHYLKVSGDGVAAGDLVLIMGYPGRTERYLTSIAVQDRQGYFYPKRLDLLTRILAVLERASQRDEASALRYASRMKSLANVQKNAEGMIWGLAKNAVVARKMREEKAFTAWVEGSAECRANYGSVLRELQEIDLETRRTQEKDMILGLFGSSLVNPLGANLIQLVRAARSFDAGEAPEVLVNRFGSAAFRVDLKEVQIPILAEMLDELRHLPPEQRDDGMAVLAPNTDAEIGPLVADLLGRTELLDPQGRVELLTGGRKAVDSSKDPLVVLIRGVCDELDARAARDQARAGRRLVVGRRWIEAQQEWRGTSFYPDANSTMRVSIATVKGYEPRDGVFYTPHTTVGGVIDKETGEEPFASPTALLEAAPARKQSRYYDHRIGDVPVCFLSDGDTTGGNSGSPVINGEGQLVGLNFDRVFQNVSGDFGWNAARSRNISVDIRYALWIMEQVLPAHHLLTELGVR